MTRIINIIGGPGAGKSTLAAGVFYELKMKGYNVELSSEYAKDLVYENRSETFKDELYIFAKQAHRLFSLRNKVDIVVTDRPLIMSLVYNEYYNTAPDAKEWNNAFNNIVRETWNRYDNIVYVLNRVNEYHHEGRNENEDQAKELDEMFKKKLEQYGVNYKLIDGDESGIKTIVDDIANKSSE